MRRGDGTRGLTQVETAYSPPTLREDSRHSVFSDVLREVLQAGRNVSFRANGGSMHPTIREGEKITVEPVAPFNIQVGDIVLYENQRRVIAHRVVAIERTECDGRRFILRADASSTGNESVESGQILGRVASVERAGRCVNLSGRKAKMACKIHACAARLKRWVRRRFDELAKAGSSNRQRASRIS